MHPLVNVKVERLMPYIFCCARLCRKTDVMATEETEEDLKKKEDEINDLREVEERLKKIVSAAGT